MISDSSSPPRPSGPARIDGSNVKVRVVSVELICPSQYPVVKVPGLRPALRSPKRKEVLYPHSPPLSRTFFRNFEISFCDSESLSTGKLLLLEESRAFLKRGFTILSVGDLICKGKFTLF